MDAAILFSDILILPWAMGQDVRFVNGEGPVLAPVRDAAALEALQPQGVPEKTAPVLETIRRLRVALPPACTLIGFTGSPFTVACYMIEGGGSRDFAATRGMAYAEPALFSRLMDLLCETTTAYLIAQIEAGCRGGHAVRHLGRSAAAFGVFAACGGAYGADRGCAEQAVSGCPSAGVPAARGHVRGGLCRADGGRWGRDRYRDRSCAGGFMGAGVCGGAGQSRSDRADCGRGCHCVGRCGVSWVQCGEGRISSTLVTASCRRPRPIMWRS